LGAGDVVVTDVCVVGAGPAGITLAREFAGRSFQVCLLESGGLEADAEAQALCGGETVGDPYQDLYKTRTRQLGGTANQWHINIRDGVPGVRHVPFDAMDFERRDWLPYSGWPITKTQLDPFYERAQSICGLGPFAYEAKAWEDARNRPLPFAQDRVKTSLFQFGPKSAFTRDHVREIDQAENIITFLNANVTELETDTTGSSVTRARAASPEGARFSVYAKVFVLAAGGIENARLLLLSNKTHKAGLGNQNDLVGRFFMDHPLIHHDILIPTDRGLFNRTALYDLRLVRDVPVMGKLTLSEAVMRREQLLNSSALLFPRYPDYLFKTFARSLRRGHRSRDSRTDAFRMLGDLDDLMAAGARWIMHKCHPAGQEKADRSGLSLGGWSALPHKEKIFSTFEVMYQLEQAPHPDNRVTLGREHDRRAGDPACRSHQASIGAAIPGGDQTANDAVACPARLFQRRPLLAGAGSRGATKACRWPESVSTPPRQR
jgi:hypothetical protein